MAKKSSSNKAKDTKKGASKKSTKQKVSTVKVTNTKAVKEEDSHPETTLVKVVFVNGSHMMIPMCYPKNELQLQFDFSNARAWADKSKQIVGSRAGRMSEKFGFDLSEL